MFAGLAIFFILTGRTLKFDMNYVYDFFFTFYLTNFCSYVWCFGKASAMLKDISTVCYGFRIAWFSAMKQNFLSGFAKRYLQIIFPKILIWGLFPIKPPSQISPGLSNKPTPLSGEET